MLRVADPTKNIIILSPTPEKKNGHLKRWLFDDWQSNPGQMLRFRRLVVKNVEVKMTLNYTIEFIVGVNNSYPHIRAAYGKSKEKLTNSVSSGLFTTYLRKFSIEMNIVSLLNVSSPAVSLKIGKKTTEEITLSPTSKPTLSLEPIRIYYLDSAITIIVIAGVMLVS